MLATACHGDINASRIAMVLVKLREGADPPLSLADHEEKTHLAGRTFGLP